ncbi:COX5A-domain-containing protein [Acaromyces ingoldii]|uniref:Cytochrome c oxidase subunit 6, mitochondrial n=1 Tax=Acaromyces ingoldii TaxID=215250 RepID=A0A316YGE9_9BASI|nr:COX5A-domain-containing protein [Acaromyces ingoldii]PWN87173.1 COX5A-domain-containing protein [Acaromyces ingoldii]
MSFLTGAIRQAAAGTSQRAMMLGRTTAPLALRQTAARCYATHQAEETFDAFNERYVSFFDGVEDLFELQRGLNNCFSYDLVPSTSVIESALRASRRVNDYSTAVRVFEGIREKVENKSQYEKYVEALKPVREELGILLKEELYTQ